MFIITAVCTLVGLAAFDKIRSKYYPYLLYAIALTLLLQVTLTSNYLVGTDINLEYYFAQLAKNEGWNSSLAHPGNSALGNVLLVPLLSHVIPTVWVFKVVFPIMFAFVPVILYFIYKDWVNEKLAFLSSFFFISVPTFFMELSGIARQQLATLFFVAVLYLVLKSNLKLQYRIPVILTLSLAAIVSHYVFGLVLMLFLGMAFITKACLNYNGRFPTWAHLLILTFVTVSSTLYYGSVASGAPLRQMTAIIPVEPHTVGPIQLGPGEVGPFLVGATVERTATPGHTPLMRFALGKDFTSADNLGKAFRVLQYLTQLLIVVGTTLLLLKNKDFRIFAGAGILILLLNVLMPGFSAILNATRFYHIALLVLSPALIVGGNFLLRSPKVTVVCLVIPYFLFTSGFMFELSEQDDISKISIPYSIGLSDHRLDLGGGFTESDEKVRSWIVSMESVRPIYADHHGYLFLQQYLGLDPNLRVLSGNPQGEYYVYVRERSKEEQVVVHWAGIGRRKHAGLEVTGEIIYRVGNAMVVKP